MDTSKFIYTIYINTTLEKLWEALTKGKITEQYWFGRSVDSDWKVNSSVIHKRKDYQLDVKGEVLKCEPLHLLSYTWKVPGDESVREECFKVTFKLEPINSIVKLILIAENLVPGDFVEDTNTFAGFTNDWPAILSNLKSFLETGKTLPGIA